jgi:hypothetical protein
MTVVTKIAILKGIAGACFVIGESLINDVVFYKANLRRKELDRRSEEIDKKFRADLEETLRQEVETGLNVVWTPITQEEIDDLFK